MGRSASAVIAGVDTRRPAVITRSGHPVAVLVPLDAASTASALEDWAMAQLPEFVRSRAAGAAQSAEASRQARPVTTAVARVDLSSAAQKDLSKLLKTMLGAEIKRVVIEELPPSHGPRSSMSSRLPRRGPGSGSAWANFASCSVH